MNKFGLFGGGWEDYQDALNDAFDQHAAASWPSSPFGASADAILAGMPDEGGVSPGSSFSDVGPVSGAVQPILADAVDPAATGALQDAAAQTAPAGNSAGNPASGGAQSASGGLGAVAGYPETGSGAYRAANDDVIRKAVADYNARNGYQAGDAGYMTPELMKAWQMQESGGSRLKDRAAFASDPFQVNKSGDWVEKKAEIMGLTKGQAMTPQTSADAALKWLQYKSWVHDNSGKPVTYKGVQQGFESYNGGHVRDYGNNILNHYNQSWGK